MYEELIGLLRDYGRDCTGNDMCENCSIQYFCENGWTPSEIADAIEALSKKEKTTQWIPVTERLPAVGKKVLVFSYGNDILTARRHKQTENGYPVFECNGIFLEMAKPGRITHWMPLLEPPKEETE